MHLLTLSVYSRSEQPVYAPEHSECPISCYIFFRRLSLGFSPLLLRTALLQIVFRLVLAVCRNLCLNWGLGLGLGLWLGLGLGLTLTLSLTLTITNRRRANSNQSETYPTKENIASCSASTTVTMRGLFSWPSSHSGASGHPTTALSGNLTDGLQSSWCPDASDTSLPSCKWGNLPAFLQHSSEARPLLVGILSVDRAQSSTNMAAPVERFIFVPRDCICTMLVHFNVGFKCSYTLD